LDDGVALLDEQIRDPARIGEKIGVTRSSSMAILPSVTSSERKPCCCTGSTVMVAHWAGVG
jgi:hypothetical protein